VRGFKNNDEASFSGSNGSNKKYTTIMFIIKVRMNERKEPPYEDVVLVASIMSGKLIKINTNSSVLEVAKKMSENRVSSVILTGDGDKIEGIVTERETFVQMMC
jgi:CBS domain-containing protein